MRDGNLNSRIVLQIHDELVVELAPGEEKRVTELVRDAMEHAVNIAVPLMCPPVWGPIGSRPPTEQVLGGVG